ncbi:MAG: hypothetical protein WC602_06445 [archaeon]
MKVLIPLITRQEDDPNFLSNATRDCDEAVLLLVIDTTEMLGQFGFAASEIMRGTALMGKIRARLPGKGVEEAMEWGGIAAKIVQVAERENADFIALKRHDSLYWRRLEAKIRGGTERKVETF